MMDFKPPTDNLYKFVAISGLITTLAAALYGPIYIDKEIRSANETKDQKPQHPLLLNAIGSARVVRGVLVQS
jgi:hypothetical protein